MTKTTLYALLNILFFQTALQAQPPAVIKIAENCSTKDLKQNLYYLASDKLEGRLIATHGDTLASRFVADKFKTAGMAAPYKGSYFQSITATKKIVTANLRFGSKTFDRYDGWSTYPGTPYKVQNAEVIYNQFADMSAISNYIGQHDVKGQVIVVPSRVMAKALDDNSIDSLEAAWRKKGIAAVLWYGPGVHRQLAQIKRYFLLPEYVNKELDAYNHVPAADDTNMLHELSLTPERMNDLLKADGLHINTDGSFADLLATPVILKTRLSIDIDQRFETVHAPNVIGIVKGSDTSLPSIVVSAHHDHQGRQPNGIYYGAVDNASGTVAILEMASMLSKAVAQGYRPKRTIVFASFTGEEKGMLGSFYYVQHPVYPMSKTYGVLNIDMMGRVDTFYSGKKADSNYAYILVMDSVKGFRKALYDANKALTGLNLDTYYERPENRQRRLLGSDQFPFYQQGVSFVRIDCGFASDYHLPTDTPDKINYELLTKQTQLAFLSLYNMANN